VEPHGLGPSAFKPTHCAAVPLKLFERLGGLSIRGFWIKIHKMKITEWSLNVAK
jgi:hypothetical protein